MIEVIHGLPAYVTAFRATGIVTTDDYHTVINPLVKTVVTAFGKVSYLLILDTSLKNYTIGAWIEDAFLGIRYFTKWKKLAIVTERDEIKKFTDVFGKLIPPQTKGFKMEELSIAKQWISDL
ncbi:MAG: STAS/SEC14 domain-containing protein [Ginsengibacter sp.]